MKKDFFLPVPTTSILIGLAVLFVGCSGASSTMTAPLPDDPNTVAVYNDSPLSLAEFEKRYARSVGGRDEAARDSLGEYSDFLDRYLDFRLKVMYAEELGLAQDSGIVSEIEAYRNQLARPYLLEREIMEPILKDLYEKKQTMVDASHILARVGRADGPADTLRAYNKIAAIRDSIEQGLDFGDLAYRNSEDPSARGNRLGARGRLGYFIGGMMVKAFEDQAYNTPIGAASKIFRSDFGYHILYVHDRKPRVPDVWAAHIAVRPQVRSLSDTTSAEDRIKAIYERLQNGEDFAELAREASEDRETAPRGGQFGKLSYTASGLPTAFRDALFALENPGDYSDIVETEYGYHIIRLENREQMKSFEESYDELKTQASRLPRVRQAEMKRAMEIRETYGVAVDSSLIIATLNGRHFKAADILETPESDMNLSVASIGDKSFTFGDVVTFAETAAVPYTPDTLQMAYNTLDLFLNDEALNYEAAKLEDTDDEFRFIMEEFRDGLLLFKLMEDSVWTAAAVDTASLMAYHAPRADSFWFPDRYRVVSFRNRSDSLLKAIKTRIDGGAALAGLVEAYVSDTTSTVRIDTTYISEPNNSIFDRALNLNPGQATDPVLNAGSYTILVNDGVEAARQKTFAEARSEVLNAYQAIVEDRLLKKLRARYGVQTAHERLAPAFAEDKVRVAEQDRLFDNTVEQ